MSEHTRTTMGHFAATASATHEPSNAQEELIEQLVGSRAAARGLWLVLAPHPDDETISAGWLLRRSHDIKIAYLTDGAPRDPQLWTAQVAHRAGYAAIRRHEVLGALALCGVGPESVHGSWVCDQEAVREIPRLVRCVLELIERLSPAILLTPPYEGGHPDHDACALIAQAAAQRMVRSGKQPPVRVEMTSYHRSERGLTTCSFLPPNTAGVRHALDAEEREHKRKMLACFASQAQTLSPFTVDAECYRRAPHYDFSKPPHDGALHYETLPFGIDGKSWRTLAMQALTELGLTKE